MTKIREFITTSILLVIAISIISCAGTAQIPNYNKILPAPKGLSFLGEMCSNDLSLSWDAVENAKSYNIYWGTESGSYSESVSTSDTTYKISSLTRFTNYFFVVSAIRDDGKEGAFSEEMTGSVSWDVAEPTPPPKPLNLTAASGDGEITVSWDHVDIDSSVRFYLISWGTKSGNYDSSVELTSNSYKISDLTNDTEYFIAVQTLLKTANPCGDNVSATSSYSDEVTATPASIYAFNDMLPIHDGTIHEKYGMFCPIPGVYEEDFAYLFAGAYTWYYFSKSFLKFDLSGLDKSKIVDAKITLIRVDTMSAPTQTEYPPIEMYTINDYGILDIIDAYNDSNLLDPNEDWNLDQTANGGLKIGEVDGSITDIEFTVPLTSLKDGLNCFLFKSNSYLRAYAFGSSDNVEPLLRPYLKLTIQK